MLQPPRRAVIASLAAMAAQAARADPSSARPNVLWLVSEDNNPFIGAYGDVLAHTPAIDRLAAEGLLYENVYSTAPVCAPSRFSIITGMWARSCGPAQHMRARAVLPAEFGAFPNRLREAGYYCTNNAKTDYNCDLDPKLVWDESSATAHWRNRPAGAPFFAVFNHETTHESQLFKITSGRVTPDQVRVPAYLPDTPEVRTDIASYYNLIEVMDRQISARLAELDAAGVTNDTIVFYYSDNGGALPRSKRYCYDEGLRCAMVVRVPPKWAHLAPRPPGSRIAEPVTFLDLAPTVLALADLPPPKHFQGKALLGRARGRPAAYAFGGRDRMDERYDMMRTVTDGRFRYIRNYAPHRPWAQHEAYEWQAAGYQAWERARMAGRLAPDQARFWGEKPAEELYDLKADRDQITNLIGRPQHGARAEAMGRALDAHMLTIGDAGFIPEGSPLEGYKESRVPGAYPLARAISLANRAIRREPTQAAAFAAELSDPNEVIRYWAAQGLLMLRAGAAPAKARLGACLANDASPHVRVVAAEALAHLGEAERAVDVLADLCSEHPNPRVRLQAVNALTYVGDAARRALPAIEAAAASKDQYLGNAGRYLSLVLSGRYRPESVVFDPKSI
jgi:arylsulfatase A-like enzyme